MTTLRPSPSIPAAAPRRAAFFAPALLALLAALFVIPAPASAAIRYFPQGRLAPPAPNTPFGELGAESVAPDDADGHVLVADSGNGLIYDYSSASDTSPTVWDGSATPTGSFGHGRVAVAVDQGTGDVYVADHTDKLVDKFDAQGNLLAAFGDAQPNPDGRLTGAATPAASFSPPGIGTLGIAIDQANGDLYVIDAGHKVIDVFSSSGEYLRQITASPTGLYTSLTDSIAVSRLTGEVYVAESGGIKDELFVFDAAGAYLETRTGSDTPVGSFGGGYVNVAVSDSTGEVLVAETTHDVADVFSSAGSYLTQFGANEAKGIAADPSGADAYASINFGSAVEIFHPFLIPDVSTEAATALTATTATLHGTVNTSATDAEAALADCHFEYATQAEGLGGLHAHTVPCEPAAALIPDDGAVHAVTAALSGLVPGTAYSFRLVAENQNHHPSFGLAEPFSTLPNPLISALAATHVTASEATLQGQVTPRGYDTHYRFQWGPCATLAACPTSPYETTVPASPPGKDIGQGTSPVAVSTQIEGLAHDTIYHFRLIAENANGTATSPGHTFVYLAEEPQLQRSCSNEALRTGLAAHLPDCRAYEQVTPVKKNGALIGNIAIGNYLDIAADGSRLIASSIQCFAGSLSCNAARETNGSPFAFGRTAAGWQTTPLAPPASLVAGNSPYGISADAGTALFAAPTPPAGEDDFYAREANGELLDIGPTNPNRGEQTSWNASPVVGTADLSHVLYESGTPGGLREFAGTINSPPFPVAVSGDKGSTDLISACGGTLGSSGGNQTSAGSLSADGATVYFTARACGSGTGANASTPVPANELYARIDGEVQGKAHTVEISARSQSECDSTCQASPPADALFRGASSDGSIAYFTSPQQLTNAATQGSNNLYLYDFARPDGERLIDVSAAGSGQSPRVQGMLELSADGSHVYFVAQGVLATNPGAAVDPGTGQPQHAEAGAENLYAYQRDAAHPSGHVAFVAALSPSDSQQWESLTPPANVTPTGNYLVFTSNSQLTPDETGSSIQVFRYDAEIETLNRVSIGERGFNDDGNAGSGAASIVSAEQGVFRLGPARLNPTMSDDGAYVFFQSPKALTPSAFNDKPINSSGALAHNIYEWEENGRGGCTEAGGCVSLISDGADTSEVDGTSSVNLLGADASGKNVFFTTVDPLGLHDGDTELDYYDARVDGGFAEPLRPTPCEGDACRERGTTSGSEQSAASGSFNGPEEDVNHPAKLRKQDKKKHSKKKRGHKKHAISHKRAGGGNRGGAK